MMKHKWLTWEPQDVRIEAEQSRDEGKVLADVQSEVDALSVHGCQDTMMDFQKRVDRLFDTITDLPISREYTHKYNEPSDLAAIKVQRPQGPRRIAHTLGDSILADKIHGAWLGRCAGCLLGKPLEGLHTPELHALIRSGGASFLTDYVWKLNPSQQAWNQAKKDSTLDYWLNMDHMPTDDDINYTIIGMGVIKKHGMAFSPNHVVNDWLSNLPLLATCTAERVAYRNFINLSEPPQSATIRNPYREWIGAQIRADIFGYVALGNPQLAAELAWRDACISHVKNGIYGEMWVAAMLATAAVQSDLQEVIQIGLSEIPAHCRLAEDVKRVLHWHEEGLTYGEVCHQIHQQWDEKNSHHWCHTNSNAQIVAIGLLWGENDYQKAITRAVWLGFDTDCNGATVGSIMGMVMGAKALPQKWTGLLNDTVKTSVSGYNLASISQTAAEMFDLYKQASQ